MVFFYARDYGDQQERSTEEVLNLILRYPQSEHHVWREGMADWVAARDVSELAEQLDIIEQAEPVLGLPYRHSMDGAYQSTALAEEIAERVKANPLARHKVWQDDFMWWPDAQSVPEIAEFGPLPPMLGESERLNGFQLMCDGKNIGVKSPQEIIEIIRQRPSGVYRVWQVGLGHWEAPSDVEAIASLGLAEIIGTSEVSSLPWLYSLNGKNLAGRTPEEIVQVIRENSNGSHRVWQIGMEQWMSPWDVPAFAELDLGDDPEALDEMPWHYSRKGVNETFLTLEQVAERVNAHPDEKHKIWQVGSERWIEPHELERLRPMLNIREEESPPRLLLYSRNRKNSRYLSAEEIVASMAEHPDGVHKVWPHLEERWLNPWEVEELQALGVEAPEEVDDLDWYYKVGNTQHRNWSSEQVAVSVIKNPDEEHLVWQLGWDRWEDPRGVPVISSMLPPEMR